MKGASLIFLSRLAPAVALAVAATHFSACASVESRSADNLDPAGNRPVPKAESRAAREVSKQIWELSDGTAVEASLRQADDGGMLTVTNLASGKVIFEEKTDDGPNYVMHRQVSDDLRDALIAVWSGGSADRMEILAVDAVSVRKVFDERYRVDATLMDVDGSGSLDVVTTAETGAAPFTTTRYRWKDGRFRVVRKIPFGRLQSALN